MDYQDIQLELRDNVAVVTLNRPNEANALTLRMAQELHEAALACDADPLVRAVVITGAGSKMFCAGGDLKGFLENADGLPSFMMRITSHLHRSISVFNRMEAPVIMAVNGTAAGGGFSFAMTGDLILAADTAKFTMAYTAAGLSPDGSSTHFLPRLIGVHRAKELMFTNRVLSAQEAMDWGLVNRVVPGAELMETAMILAADLAQGPTMAFGVVKALLLDSQNAPLDTQMEYEARGMANIVRTQDAQEGIAAFVEKRKPNFVGG
ncbi:MAG: enoyl-CoA hydratase [Sneathiellaceae bacterium]